MADPIMLYKGTNILGGMEQLSLDIFGPKESIITQIFDVVNGYIEHPLIKPKIVHHRVFQHTIAERSCGKNTLIVLPTGLGKTIIALLVTAKTLHQKSGKVIFTAPTRPLIEQHYETFSSLMVQGVQMGIMVGSVPPRKRTKIFNEANIVFSTPQCLANDFEKERYSPDEVALIIIDEAHRTVGNYAYVHLCERINAPILGLTASPGGKRKKIQEVITNLETEIIEARTRNDPDVKRYIKDIDVEWIKVELNDEMTRIQAVLEDYLYSKVKKLQGIGILSYKKVNNVSKTELLGARELITKRFRRNRGVMFGAIHNQSLAVYAFHCLETLETQGVHQLQDYLERMTDEKKKVKSRKAFLRDQRIQDVLKLSKKFSKISHPKLKHIREIISEEVKLNPECRIIVFTQLRDTIPTIIEELVKDDIDYRRFVGQAKRADGAGLKQQEQKEILDDFRKKGFNVLIATSVAEEGLDIPDVDIVIFYEPIPSEIRTIQRRGRTGRSSIGRVKVLITTSTRDEAYLWAEVQREKKMKGMIRWMEVKGINFKKVNPYRKAVQMLI